MLATNAKKLVKISVQGKIQHPIAGNPYRLDHEGRGHILPATGGIVYNVQVGDPAIGWVSDHTEPGVTIKNDKDRCNLALNLYACIGNEAKVINGEAKGAKGFVTGTHGGVEHVMIYFPQDDLEKMAIGDKILIKAWGQGLSLLNYPDIMLLNMAPELFEKLNISPNNGKLQVPVAAIVPPYLMGSGLGAITAGRGDYDIMTTDRNAIQENNLEGLKLGDIVLLQDCINTYGRAYLKGAVSIGVVIHGDSVKQGHGPGVATIMTSTRGLLEGVLEPKANIAHYLGIVKN